MSASLRRREYCNVFKGRLPQKKVWEPLSYMIDDPEDQRLFFLPEFCDIPMAFQMTDKQGCRIKQLSKDAALAIPQTCYGLVSLCRHLLATTHKHVLEKTSPSMLNFGDLNPTT